MASSFTRDFGRRQGRIEPTGVTPPAGSFVFCLGYDKPNHREELQAGDYVQISQAATFAVGTRLVRVTADLRAPGAIPAGYQWVLTFLIDNVERARHVFAPSALLRRKQLSANVSKLGGGSHTVTLRLRLEDTAGTQYAHPSGIASAEAFGVPTVTQ